MLNTQLNFRTRTSSQLQTLFIALFLVCSSFILFNAPTASANNNQFPASVTAAIEGHAWVARHGMTSSQYQQRFNEYTKKGYRPVHVNGYTVNGTGRFTAIWVKKSGGAYVARHGMSSSSYQKEFNKWTKQGYRLTCISGYEDNGQAKYAAIFEKKSGAGWYSYHGMNSADLMKKNASFKSKGYAPVFVDGYTVRGRTYFAAIWVKGANSKFELRVDQSSAQYQNMFNACTKLGYRPVSVSAYTSARHGILYVSLFIKKSGPAFYAYHGMSSSTYQSKFNSLTKKGYTLKYVNGCGTGNSARYAAVFEK